MTPPACRTVLLVPDECLGWHALRKALETLPGVRLVPDAPNLPAAWERAHVYQPDVIVTASMCVGESAFGLLARLRPVLPAATFIVIAERHHADELLCISSIGVASYLVWRDLSTHGLSCTLAAAMSGQFTILSNDVAAAHIAAERGRFAAAGPAPTLTVRERAILRGLFEGLTQQQIARLESVSLSTVARDIQSLEDKLGASDRFVLGAKAAGFGLVP